jgi:hypothetical protein
LHGYAEADPEDRMAHFEKKMVQEKKMYINTGIENCSIRIV